MDPELRPHRGQHLLPGVDLRGLAGAQPPPQVRQRARLRRRLRGHGSLPGLRRLPGVQEGQGVHVRAGVGAGAGAGGGWRRAGRGVVRGRRRPAGAVQEGPG